MKGLQAYVLSRNFTSDTADSLGSLKGAPCQIESIVYDEQAGTVTITFSWTGTSGKVQTDTAVIHDGKDGLDGKDGQDGAKGDKGDKGENGTDGTGITKIDSEGNTLIIELSDGTSTEVTIPTVGVDNLAELADIDLGELSDGQVLVWDATTGKWTNRDGSGGTPDYVDLSNKPSIENVTLSGNKSASDLGLAKITDLADFITKTVDDLVNYYKKTETYTKGEVDTIVTAIKNSRFEVVATLPTSDIKTNVIYLVPKAESESGDIKDEYINLDGTTAGWERIGSTDIDLSGYVTTTALNTALANYTTTTDLTALLADKQDKVQYSSLPTASAELEGKIFEYTGVTGGGLTHGYFYECKPEGGSYVWTRIDVQPSGGGSSATVLTQTLTAGNTSVTFTNLPTTGNNLVDFFTSTGINYTDIDVSTAGQVTLTFDAQIVDVVVYCKIEEVTV